MKTIDFTPRGNILIHYDRITPFTNVCKVTGVEEKVNLVVEYVPNDKVIDIVDYRKFFERKFNNLIEEIAQLVFDEIERSAHPKHIMVQVFLEGNSKLTDWNVKITK